jgi:hypothetical protein
MQADGKRQLATGPSPQREVCLMSQADSANTTTLLRVEFSSAGATRARQTYSTVGFIRAGMATPKPPTGIQLNFANLLDHLREEGPAHSIVGITDQGELEERTDHLEAVLNAITSYVEGRGRPYRL